jgi:Ca-activated chloride channel homolog
VGVLLEEELTAVPIAIETPSALLLLLALPAIYFVARERLSMMTPWRGMAVLAVRLLLMAAAILALSGPSIPWKDATMSVAFVLDSSDSISAATRAEQERWVQQAVAGMRSTDQSAVVVFAGEPRVAKALSSEKEFRMPARGVLQSETDLSRALKLASGLLPSAGLRKVVLLSDGWDTTGGTRDAVRSLPDGTRLEVVPLTAMSGQPEILIESLEVPAYVREGDSFDVSVVVGSSHEGAVEVRLLVNGRETDNWQVQVGPGANLVTMFQSPLPLGFHSVEVQLVGGGDTVPENNSALGFVVVKSKGGVLLIQGGPEPGDGLMHMLQSHGLQVEQRPANQFPTQMVELLPFDAVVLDDVSGLDLSLDQFKILDAYVKEQGGGLTVLGGQASFGLGDYASSPLEEILPVTSNVPLTRDRGDMAIILVIDRSGSMDDSSQGVTRMEMAREAALLATEVLRPDDQIGVLAFDIDSDWVVPPQVVGDGLDDIRNRISRIRASGGTDIYSALEEAFEAAKDLRATQKHVTLLSDGQSWKGPYELLMEKYRTQRITLSSIAIGSDADQEYLLALARLGNGRYYFTENMVDIPSIAYREISLATRVAEVQGEVDPIFVSPSPVLRGVEVEGLPSLGGYVATQPKDAATVVLRSERGDPLLAHWHYGLGKVAAWTSDSEGLWSTRWASDEQGARIWDQAVRWAMPPPIDRSLQVSTRVDGKSATVTANSVDHNGLFIDLVETRAEIWHPNGNRLEVPLLQAGPGRYEATVPSGEAGLYRVEVRQSRGDGREVTETGGYAVPNAPEFRRLGGNEALLKELAYMTGGRAIMDPADAFSREGMPSIPGWEPLWPYLLALSMLLLPVEVALRRVRSLPFRSNRRDAGGGEDTG